MLFLRTVLIIAGVVAAVIGCIMTFAVLIIGGGILWFVLWLAGLAVFIGGLCVKPHDFIRGY